MNSRPQIILLGSQLTKCWGVYFNRPRVQFLEGIHLQYFTDLFTNESSLMNLRGYIRSIDGFLADHIQNLPSPTHL